jgi:hypothetical protein
VNRLGAWVHLAAGLLALALVGLVLHASLARRARASSAEAIHAAVAALPSPDFALSGSGRHLRHVSLAEPGAAFADEIASPDGDPAGGAMAPPRAVWVEANDWQRADLTAESSKDR